MSDLGNIDESLRTLNDKNIVDLLLHDMIMKSLITKKKFKNPLNNP